MSWVNAGMVGMGLALAVNAIIPPIGERPFMVVSDMRVTADLQVVAERTIRRDMVADWDVVIVGKTWEAPACRTVPGMQKHEGWSPYLADQERTLSFSMDDWVWDKGCAARLIPGTYKMSVIWKPRDGSRVVEAETVFTVGGSS